MGDGDGERAETWRHIMALRPLLSLHARYRVAPAGGHRDGHNDYPEDVRRVARAPGPGGSSSSSSSGGGSYTVDLDVELDPHTTVYQLVFSPDHHEQCVIGYFSTMAGATAFMDQQWQLCWAEYNQEESPYWALRLPRGWKTRRRQVVYLVAVNDTQFEARALSCLRRR